MMSANGTLLSANQNRIKDKKIVVTGGTTGIGRATTMLLASHGAKLLIVGRHQQHLEDTLNDLKDIRDDVIGLTADVSSYDDLKCIFEHVDHQLDGIDILINNAAVGDDVFKEGYDQWKYMCDTNLLGFIACAKFASERMEGKGYGHIVNIGSLSAEERQSGDEVYAATKAAIRAFSESLKKSVNPKGIKVTLIEPGLAGSEKKMLKAEEVAETVMQSLT